MNGKDWIVSCPACGKEVRYGESAQKQSFPFCCERCKLIDLSKWLEGEHRISEPLRNGEDSAGLGADEGGEKD